MASKPWNYIQRSKAGGSDRHLLRPVCGVIRRPNQNLRRNDHNTQSAKFKDQSTPEPYPPRFRGELRWRLKHTVLTLVTLASCCSQISYSLDGDGLDSKERPTIRSVSLTTDTSALASLPPLHPKQEFNSTLVKSTQGIVPYQPSYLQSTATSAIDAQVSPAKTSRDADLETAASGKKKMMKKKKKMEKKHKEWKKGKKHKKKKYESKKKKGGMEKKKKGKHLTFDFSHANQ